MDTPVTIGNNPRTVVTAVRRTGRNRAAPAAITDLLKCHAAQPQRVDVIDQNNGIVHHDTGQGYNVDT
jgi:hypothetical protein